MVHVQAALGTPVIPGERVVRVLAVETVALGELRHERGLVVRGAAHPAVGQPLPDGDGIACCAQIVRRISRLEKRVRADALPVDADQPGTVFGFVQGVVKARDGAGGVAERGMLADVAHAFAPEPDFATVVEAREVFSTVEKPIGLRYRVCFCCGH